MGNFCRSSPFKIILSKMKFHSFYSNSELCRYISSDCDSLEVMFDSQHYTRTPEETAADALKAGVDLNCGDHLRKFTLAAVQKGLAAEADVNRAVKNNFAMLMRLGFFDGDPRQHIYGNLGLNDICTLENQELAREAARQGFVLLKNSPGSLPLSPRATKSIAVIGPNANVTKTMIGNYAGKSNKRILTISDFPII